MKPVNSKERSVAFQRFLLFFILTLAVIVVTIFSGIQIPYKENSKLRAQIAVADSEQVFRNEFLANLRQAQSLLDTVNQSAAASGLIDGRITQKIQELDAMYAKTPDVNNKDLYGQIIKGLNNARSDKAALRAAGNKDSVVAMYNKQIQDLNNSLTKWQESYRQLEMQNVILKQR
ncbi:type VI secretion system TssO [Niabella insulamsoli]|uniref:type VI secretion system TssO n=1 Tax=Niabella insulamsoli TaxID=3144874 RepID=UPI0031FD9B31